jgi:hypothetical protein
MGNSAISAAGSAVQHQDPQAVNPGGEIKAYPVRHQKLKHAFWTLVGVLLLLSALAALLYGAFMSWRAVLAHGRSVLLRTAPLPLLGFLLALLLGIVTLSVTARHWQDNLTLYVNGLDLHKGKTQRFLAWSAIRRFDAQIKVVKFATSNLDVRSKMLLEDEDGHVHRLTDRFTDLSDLIGQVRNRLLPILYQNTIQRLQAGDEIPFHSRLTASSEGMVIHGNLHAWDTIEGRIHRHSLRIKQCTNDQILFRQNTKRVKNLDLLMTLLENPPQA